MENKGKLLFVLILFCSESLKHQMFNDDLFLCVQDQAWTSSSSRAAAQSLQEALLRVGGWRDSSHLLMGDGRRDGEEMGRRKELLGGILDVLQPQLTK